MDNCLADNYNSLIVSIHKPVIFKRDLGAFISPRDITQLFEKSVEVENIENEYGIPWQVVYGISNNTRALW